MSMYEFFETVLGTPDNANIILWCTCAICVFYAVIDFIHIFYDAIFSWLKK